MLMHTHSLHQSEAQTATSVHEQVSRVVSNVAQVREVGDGNINFVYIVEGPAGGLVVKQGLPYIRIARDWALTQVRSTTL